MPERISFTKVFNQEYFFVYDLSYGLQTYINQSASYVTIKKFFKLSHQLLISFKWNKSININLAYFKINLVFHTRFLKTKYFLMANVTMAKTSLSTIELIFFNNAIFPAISRIRHILKQRSDINRAFCRNQKMSLLLIRYWKLLENLGMTNTIINQFPRSISKMIWQRPRQGPTR